MFLLFSSHLFASRHFSSHLLFLLSTASSFRVSSLSLSRFLSVPSSLCLSLWSISHPLGIGSEFTPSEEEGVLVNCLLMFRQSAKHRSGLRLECLLGDCFGKLFADLNLLLTKPIVERVSTRALGSSWTNRFLHFSRAASRFAFRGESWHQHANTRAFASFCPTRLLHFISAANRFACRGRNRRHQHANTNQMFIRTRFIMAACLLSWQYGCVVRC